MAVLFSPLRTAMALLFALLAGVLVSAGAEAQLGKNDLPPPGFQWRACAQVECAFLVPENWTFQRLQNSRVLKFQMMPKLYNRTIAPVVRINIIQNTEAVTGLSAERHTELFVREAKRTGKVLDIWKNSAGLLRSTAVMSLQMSRAQQAVQKFNLLIRNTRTGTFYVVSFESAPEYWEQDWRVIERVVSSLRLDENV